MTQAHEETTFSFSAAAPRPDDARRATPHMTILRVGTLITEAARELCLVRNISAGGLKAHVYCALDEGQEISVELKSNHEIPGNVSWISNSNVGISFTQPIDVEEMLNHSALDNGWQPRLPRVEVDRLATLRVGARVFAVSTIDISQGGIKLETDDPVEAGDEVVLTLDGLRPVPGIVRWYYEGLCGISFNQVIPFHDLMRWLRA